MLRYNAVMAFEVGGKKLQEAGEMGGLSYTVIQSASLFLLRHCHRELREGRNSMRTEGWKLTALKALGFDSVTFLLLWWVISASFMGLCFETLQRRSHSPNPNRRYFSLQEHLSYNCSSQVQKRKSVIRNKLGEFRISNDFYCMVCRL